MKKLSLILTVWNVGQGQWVTLQDAKTCRHIDLGGEKIAKIAEISRECQGLENQIAITHWDYDHYGFLLKFKSRVGKICWLHKPPGAPPAIERNTSDIEKCKTPGDLEQLQKDHLMSKKKNDLSLVFVDPRAQVLVPGDSPQKQEKKWLHNLHQRIRILVLGHHGSRTSTSNALLNRLVGLQMTVASQREKKYGHPHRETKEKLLRRRLPLLRTEDWGNLRFIYEEPMGPEEQPHLNENH